MAIKILFGKPLLTCDFPKCNKSLHLTTKRQINNPEDKLQEYGWLSFQLIKSKLIIFLCKQHKHIPSQTQKQIQQIKENAYKIK